MYLSLDWLKDYVDIPRSVSPEELGLRMTMHTVEIDSVEKQAEKFDKIVVGEILEINKHPNADKLQLVKVDVKAEKLDIVCGAANIKPGQKVPVALVGAVLPNGMEIRPVEIRGTASSGMLCAEDEIGLGDDHSGILILDPKAKTGQNLADYLKIEDVVFEVDNKSITHRADLWSHFGMAREIAAFLGAKLKQDLSRKNLEKLKPDSNKADLDVKIEDFKLCPRYMALAVSGIKVEPSPKWLQERLIAVGLRPINNIVDISNYVMLDVGQPLHAFDARELDSKNNSAGNKPGKFNCRILVRQAKAGEVIETLDGQKRELDEEMLLITDGERPVAIAGVMGGYNSEINDNTDTIVIESANFDFISIRKTSSRLGLRTEASMRYEKALDPNLCETALARALELIKKICPQAEIASEVADEKKFSLYRGPIKVEAAWLKKFIGEQIEEDKIVKILASLGFHVNFSEREMEITVPTWRAGRDIAAKEDIAEEVARVYGYDNIIPKMPKIEIRALRDYENKKLIRGIKQALTCVSGMTECYCYSFVNEGVLKKLGLDYSRHIRLANPISKEMTLLRQNLAPNLINAVRLNQARYDEINLFEVGSVFLSEMEGEIKKRQDSEEKLPYQEKRLGLVSAGNSNRDYFSKLKGIIEYLLKHFGLEAVWRPTETIPAWADAKQAASLNLNQAPIGIIAALDQNIAKRSGIKKPSVLAEINLKSLLEIINSRGYKKYQQFEKFPSAVRDLAFVVNEKLMYNDIKDEIINFHPFIKKADLFDVYSGDRLGKGKKNLAFHIVYQADKTFTADEIDKIQADLIKRLKEKLDAKVRDF